MLRVIQRLGYLLVGWTAVGVFLYVNWRIPRLPFVLDLVGQLPPWAILGGAGAWCIAVLGLVAAQVIPRDASVAPAMFVGGLGGSIVLVVFPIYLLYRGEGWESDLGLAIGFFWVVCVLTSKISFLIRTRAERRQHQSSHSQTSRSADSPDH